MPAALSRFGTLTEFDTLAEFDKVAEYSFGPLPMVELSRSINIPWPLALLTVILKVARNSFQHFPRRSV